MANNGNDDCLSVNSSDFVRFPNTPMEREECDDLDLDEGQKTPNGLAAPSSIDPSVVAALMKKVDLLEVRVDGLSSENCVLKYQNDKLGKENSGLLEKMDALMAQQQAMDREIHVLRERLPSAKLLAKFMHNQEHENTKYMLVDNYNRAMWDTSDSKLTVTNFTAAQFVQHAETMSISSTSDQLIHNIHYFEITIEEMGSNFVGLAAKNYPMDNPIGFSPHLFGISVRDDGSVWHLDKVWATLGSDFVEGDVVGCGLMVAQRTTSAEAADCVECKQKQCAIFFTCNGELLGTPIPLPSNVPSMLYPAITFLDYGTKMTANFGQHPFKYAIPPAKGLNVCGHCNNAV